MKVASVTVTAMIHGLIASRSERAYAVGMEAVTVLISAPPTFDARRDRPVPSNVWYDAASDQSVAYRDWRGMWNVESRTNTPGKHYQHCAAPHSKGCSRSPPSRSPGREPPQQQP